MQKVEILRIVSPSDFWITERHSDSFLELIHKEIKKETESFSSGYSEYHSPFEQKDLEQSFLAVNEKRTKKWFRAIVVAKVSSFSEMQHFKCFLIDTGETIVVAKNLCSKIYNKNLQMLPPLAKHCSLFGIEPAKYLKKIILYKGFSLKVNIVNQQIT